MPPVSVYEQGGRYMARLDPAGIYGWLLNLSDEQFRFIGWQDTRNIPFPGEADRTCDTVGYLVNLEVGGVPWLIVLEFQSEPDPDMFGRLLEYLGTLIRRLRPDGGRGDRFAVGALVVNLTGKGQSSQTCAWPQAGLLTALEGVDRNLAEMSADEVLAGIEAGKITRAVLGWIPLMQGSDEASIIQRWKVQAGAETSAARKADHAGLALVFAEKAGNAEVWKQALEGWNVSESRQVLEWQQVARSEGLKEGRSEGLKEGRSEGAARFRRLIVTVLRQVYPQGVPAELEAVVEKQSDLERLSEWAEALLGVTSPEVARQVLVGGSGSHDESNQP